VGNHFELGLQGVQGVSGVGLGCDGVLSFDITVLIHIGIGFFPSLNMTFVAESVGIVFSGEMISSKYPSPNFFSVTLNFFDRLSIEVILYFESGLKLM